MSAQPPPAPTPFLSFMPECPPQVLLGEAATHPSGTGPETLFCQFQSSHWHLINVGKEGNTCWRDFFVFVFVVFLKIFLSLQC